MNKEFEMAIQQICDEKNISKEIVMETINAAIASAYRKDYGTSEQKICAEFDAETQNSRIFRVYDIVEKEDLENDEAQKLLKDAKKINKKVKIGEEVKVEIKNPPQDFGRIAAQTAKQVII
ncbi:MAG: NusA N-terminal domain-containing protein, partial [Ignavibacteria bacterium]|nr:NusA N-terminal domain-containing protein [Ignavibacteria bacterium]